MVKGASVIRLRRSQAVAGLTTERITAFSDGVFSIAITLLVLNLHVPTIPSNVPSYKVPGDLLDQLGTQWPSLLSYLLSFVIVGIYWVAHHNMFHYIKRSDRPFLWINILLLMCVAFIPFPAGLLGQYPTQRISVIIYASSLILTNLMLSLLWWYATSNYRLVDQDLDPHFVRTVNRRNMTAPVVYLVSIGLSFLSPLASLIVFFLFPLYYIIPSHIDLHLTPTSRTKEEPKEHEDSTGEESSITGGEGEEDTS
jgi:TMEM175 potassium channel family protein